MWLTDSTNGNGLTFEASAPLGWRTTPFNIQGESVFGTWPVREWLKKEHQTTFRFRIKCTQLYTMFLL